jgi:hypothetical protein
MERLLAEMDEIIDDMRAWRTETMVCQETTKARLECKEPTLVNMESGAEHREVSKEHAEVEPVGGLRKRHRGRNLAGGKYPGKLWIPEEIGRHRQKDNPPCRSGTSQETLQGQGWTRNFGKTDAREETSGESGRQHWNKGPRPKEAAASRKQEDIQWDLQGDFWAGDRKANSRIFCQISKNHGLDIVEGLAPS